MKDLKLTRTMEFVCLDNFNNPVYRCQETNTLYKDVAWKLTGEYKSELVDCGNEFDGDPGYPINPEFEVVFVNKYVENPHKLEYMLLSRLQSDCEYYLGNGNRHAGHLWAKDEQSQIAKMKEFYNIFPDDEKPEWLTWEQILKYERLMCG